MAAKPRGKGQYRQMSDEHDVRKMSIDPDRLLPGEQAGTNDRDDAAHWINVYTELQATKRQLISNLRDLAAQTLDEVRKLALELRPSVLDDLGLAAALRQYVRSTEERSGVAAQLALIGWDETEARLPPEVETALFRIAQEALTNVIRHAQATAVQVRLRREPGAVSLEVRDDGVGLKALPATQPGEHLGMFGMRERARLLGGELQVRSVPPHGTLVQVKIPL